MDGARFYRGFCAAFFFFLGEVRSSKGSLNAGVDCSTGVAIAPHPLSGNDEALGDLALDGEAVEMR
jgi:hypothetical protein